ncbi:HupE/UreJ family protein [Cryobacterium cryoconiti]|uniref:HupE/UreJ family protein n=1 Tax=Cryobacterium cryoconiti TaxID=1259239 RepID=A0A4Y8JVR4_9MICO|nr:HupE/UreJ family protein [Cryobacterium cryoconiti]TFD32068.1 HupE/UreJ family protein [Cryobacterium cryoconiti]
MRNSALAALTVLAGVAALILGVAAPASAHVLPTSTVVLEVHDDAMDAQLRIPVTDLVSASGINLGDETAADLAAHDSAVAAYIARHFAPESATAHLVPPDGADPRMFDLGYDVVVHRIVTHAVIVSVQNDWSGGVVESARGLGTIRRDTVTGEITPLTVDLGAASAWTGFTSLVSLGLSHIREGVDHQLFLLTLLLPAPLIVAAGRWAGPARPRTAVKRIASITIAFTIGHSVTLALGALGLPAPQPVVEALIAVSILIAAVHAVHPIFAGREAVVATAFGLVHGLAFSATLTGLHLSGGQLVLSLLGFNLGIELMQLIVVALVLPPLMVLARTRSYRPLRLAAACATGIAAVGWLAQRVGFANPIASAADGIEGVSVYLVVVLWISALTVVGYARLPLTRSGRSAAGRLTGSSIRYPWENAS